jgi:hypothetical protein
MVPAKGFINYGRTLLVLIMFDGIYGSSITRGRCGILRMIGKNVNFPGEFLES